MTRLFVILLLIAALAAGIAWFADNPGRLTLDWLGYRIETSVALLALVSALLFLLGLAIQRLATWLLRDLPFAPEKRRQRRQARGYEALNAAMVALSAGDRRHALKLTRKATTLLPPQPLTHVMAAEAAKLADDTDTAVAHYKALAEDKDAAFLGIRGLLGEARTAGRTEEARRLAVEATALRPKSQWALRARFDLEVREADWSAAEETLGRARAAGAFSPDAAAQHRGALLYCRAVEADLSGRADEALRLVRKALSPRPGFVPAALLGARLEASRGRPKEAAAMLQRAWQEMPHPSLAARFVELEPDESSDARIARIERFLGKHRNHLEARLVLAAAALDAGRGDLAREALDPATASGDARACRLLARLADRDGDDSAARRWREAAASAQPGDRWICAGCAAHREKWAPLCPSCGRFDSFQWRSGRAEPVGALESSRPIALLDAAPSRADASDVVAEER